MVSSGLLRRVAHVRTDVSEEPGASFIRVTKIGEQGTTEAATSNRRTLPYLHQLKFLCFYLDIYVNGILVLTKLHRPTASRNYLVIEINFNR
jgi:hypothetical protein